MNVKVFKKDEVYFLIFNNQGDVSDLFHTDDIGVIKRLHDSIVGVLAGKGDNASITKGDEIAVVKVNDGAYIVSVAVNSLLSKGYKFTPQELRHFVSMLENLLV
jgi:hypothetical protein